LGLLRCPAHIGADAALGLVQGLSCTAANAADVNEAEQLLHREERCVFTEVG